MPDVPEIFHLRQWTTCGGCAAKWGGADLASLVRQVAGEADHDLLVGLAPFDDAAVYRLTADTTLVSTTDFFPPLVDDPDDFGAIAAANACSDVFAMGGRVILALNIAAFPEEFPADVVASILGSATETVVAAGGQVAGGHTIRSPEPIFGLAVQGIVHPDRIWTKGGARVGDRLVLSKPLGTGLVLAADDLGHQALVIAGMRQLNRLSAEQLRAVEESGSGSGVHAVTDVTGFGLAGHAFEIAERSKVAIRLDTTLIPLYDGALAATAAGLRTGGEDRNRAYLGDGFLNRASGLFGSIVLDPQTSGGLLASVEPADVEQLVDQGWWEIGEVVDGQARVELA